MEVSEEEEDPPVGLPVVEVVRQVGDPFLIGAPFLGTSSFTLSPSINLFTNQLNVLGLDWVDGIKNLTLSSQPLELPTPISVACIEEPPSNSVLELIVVEVSPPISPPELTDSGYFLHSCTKWSSRG